MALSRFSLTAFFASFICSLTAFFASLTCLSASAMASFHLGTTAALAFHTIDPMNIITLIFIGSSSVTPAAS